MKRNVQILAGLLVAQLGLAAVTWGTRGSVGTDDSHRLFEFDAKAVTAVTVVAPATGEKPETSITLKKQGEGWVVSGADDYPAQTEKVAELVEKLSNLKVHDPVATQTLSHNGLKVADDQFDKKISLVAGADHTVLVGGAKGASLHVRKAGDEAVYLGRGISAWAISDRTTAYVDTQYVKVADPTRVTVQNPAGTLSLVKGEDGNWQVAELPPDAKVDESRVNAFVSAARSLQLTEPVGKTIKPEFGLDQGTTVTLASGDQTVRYVVGAKIDKDHYVKADDSPFVVRVSHYSVETLLTQTPDRFLPDATAPGGGPGGMPGGMPPGMMPGGMPPGMMPPGMGMPGH